MADRYFINGGVNNNWGDTGNWSTSSGGAGGASVPTSSDDVFFDASSPNCTVDTSARACKNFDSTGYNGTITLNVALNINPASGQTVIFSATTVFAGASILGLVGPNASVSITTNGITIAVQVDWSSNSGTWVLNDDFNISGHLRFTGSNCSRNGNNILASGSFTQTGGNQGGTSVLKATGTGTWQHTGGRLQNTFEIDTAGTITFGAAFNYGGTGTLTYTAGTVITTGNTFNINGSLTLDCAGITWDTFGAGGVTLTLLDDLNVTNWLGGTVIWVGGFDVNIGGNLTINQFTGLTTGSVTYRLVGTGIFSMSGGHAIGVPLEIDTAGIITLSGNLDMRAMTFTYTSGTVVGASNPTIVHSFGTRPILDLNGLVLDASLSAQGGSLGFKLASGVEIAAGRSITLVGSSGGSRTILDTTSSGVQQKFTLQSGVTTNIRFHDSTDIDSGDGIFVIWRRPGTMTNTINWVTPNGSTGNGGGNNGNPGVIVQRPGKPNIYFYGNPSN